MAREINLVPDVKEEMIKALKLRNLILFLSIVVASASVCVIIIFGVIAGGQQIIVDNNQETIKNLSEKLTSYSDLSNFLTIKDQLGNIATTTSNKKVLSRTFNILRTLLPTGADTITISELSVNLAAESPTFTFDAQANAGKEPFIDYNVLDAFKKSMKYMRYDHGRYVDKDGKTIPSYCMIEQDADGGMLKEGEALYAYWTFEADGCIPSENAKIEEEYDVTSYADQRVVRIWRTPQFDEWYKNSKMTLTGDISGVPHFASSCITYAGDDSASKAQPKWTPTNNCMLVPGEESGIKITDSSNGRGANDELVLRFSATISLNPEVYKFTNTHVLAIPPSGRYNVTDSYVQVQTMFGERAADCLEGDSSCNNAPVDNTNNSSSTDSSNNNASNSNGGNNG